MRRGLALLPVVLLAACGGGDDSDDSGPPAQKANDEPRVEGKWRVVCTPFSGQESRATWTTKPACAEGSCDFTIKSTAGAQHHFIYDPAIKDWTGRDRQTAACAEEFSEEVAAEHGFTVVSQITLTPIRAVRSDTGTFVTEMFGDRRDEYTPNSAGKKANCGSGGDEQSSVRAVRVDPPAGDEQTVGPQGEEGVPPGD